MAKKEKVPATVQEIIDRAQEHVAALITQKWPEIDRILEKDEEISLGFAVKLTHKGDASPGEHADKANRLKTTLSFSERFTASMDAELEDPNQPGLDLGDRAATGAGEERATKRASRRRKEAAE